MSKQIFLNKATNGVSAIYKAQGKIQVDVSGVIGGADVITWMKGANGVATLVRTCSWLSSQGDTLGLPGYNADAGYEFLENCEVYFEIKNASGTTNISLQFDSGFIV
jgi:hypothetical protein